jgi:hypothetical protein
MTWKEFKEIIEAQGVTDDTEIRWIDTCGLDLLVKFSDDGKEVTIE